MRVGIYGLPRFQELLAVADGCKAIGAATEWRRHSVFDNTQVELFDAVVVHGTRLSGGIVRDAYRRSNVPVVVVDLPPIRKCGYYALWPYEVNAIPSGDFPDDRLSDMMQTRPPRPGGAGVLLCGQKDGDAAHLMDAAAMRRWVAEAVARIRMHTAEPITWRPHPQFLFEPVGVDRFSDPYSISFKRELEADWAAVATYNSTTGLQAAAAGLAVFCDPRCWYREVAEIDWRKMREPEAKFEEDVRAFLARVSYVQWTLDEIAGGKPVELTLQRMGAA